MNSNVLLFIGRDDTTTQKLHYIPLQSHGCQASCTLGCNNLQTCVGNNLLTSDDNQIEIMYKHNVNCSTYSLFLLNK